MTDTQLALFDSPPRIVAAPGFVYYGTDGVNIKIGYTTSPVRRGGELKITMLHTMPGSIDDERANHRRWFRNRIDGTEWFRPSRELLRWLDDQVPPGTHARAALRMLIFQPREPVDL
jgi:hypothetical protein